MWLSHQSLVYFGCFFLLLFTYTQQEEANGLLTFIKQEKVERDDCNLDLKLEVNIHPECGLSSGKCVSSIKRMVPLQEAGRSLEEVSKDPVNLSN